ncbi:MAG: hypothetical protein ACREMD_14715 [Gemmatimonadota bacterium]
MDERSPARDASRVLEALAVQLEIDRRAFFWGNAIYVGANLVLGGLVWGSPEGLLAWLPAAVAFLGNVFYALTAEWELRWRAVWRRELPRLESETGVDVLSRVSGTAAGLGRGLRLLCWAISAVWLVILLLAIGEAEWMPALTEIGPG